LVLPDTYYKSFVETLLKEAGVTDYHLDSRLSLTFTCSESFPHLFFNIQSSWLEVLPEDYIIDVSNGERSLCSLMIRPTDDNFAVFGLPLFYGYYSTHYLTDGRLGFTPHNQSKKKDVWTNEMSTKSPFKTLTK
jgi:hypothetical protein